MSLFARGRKNEKWWFWEDSPEQTAPNAQCENPPTDDGWHDKTKNKNFSVYIPYPFSFSSLISIFHALTWPTPTTGVTTRWLAPTIIIYLLYFSMPTWPISITGVTTRWLVSNHFARANWPDFTADRLLLSTLRLFKATATEKKHSFSQYIPQDFLTRFFYCTYQTSSENAKNGLKIFLQFKWS